MSNKAQVLFTFEMKGHTETPRHGGVDVMDLVAVNVQSRGIDVDEEADGPHTVYAHILRRNAPAIISFLNDEFKEAVKAMGGEMHVHNLGDNVNSGDIH
ncbi:hypothetical protein E2375_14665 [Salmonella enterica subsp. enterica serovar Muenchen]|nr:hypothetical protein [Salmonella enterica subsp. enterica serovar Muenchen]